MTAHYFINTFGGNKNLYLTLRNITLHYIASHNDRLILYKARDYSRAFQYYALLDKTRQHMTRRYTTQRNVKSL